MNDQETKGSERGAQGVAKTTLGLVLGLILGLTFGVSDGGSKNAKAQSSAYMDSNDYKATIDANAAPRVAFDSDGQARFSRPLEVPPLYAFDSPLDESGRQIILVDSETKRICVYWIRRRGVNSTIELVATRAFELDLKLENFNGEGLSPGQIREQLESTR